MDHTQPTKGMDPYLWWVVYVEVWVATHNPHQPPLKIKECNYWGGTPIGPPNIGDHHPNAWGVLPPMHWGGSLLVILMCVYLRNN